MGGYLLRTIKSYSHDRPQPPSDTTLGEVNEKAVHVMKQIIGEMAPDIKLSPRDTGVLSR